tara:strand:+ start:211 stop:666 length:456 start_codon:yes stop_codon:yes gene_type:complete
MKLNTLNIKLKEKKKRLGRGIGSSKGKTSGRGHKGQKSRSGVAIKSFEGGQMPLYRRLPKRGFKTLKNKKDVALFNLDKLQKIMKKNQGIENFKFNLASLQKSNLLTKRYKKIKVLGSGELKEKFDIEVNSISKTAKKKIEEIGGKVILVK